VPDDARRRLKARAAARGESLNTYLLELLERDVARPNVEEVLDRAARRAERAAASALDALEVQRWPSGDGLRRRAFQLRDNLSAYDAAYVVLAEALECSLVTRDARLATTSGHVVRIEVR
jgi:predicted nucleic acid-binding protein